MVRNLLSRAQPDTAVSPTVTMYFVSEMGLLTDSSLTLRAGTIFFKCSGRDLAQCNKRASAYAHDFDPLAERTME
jgi:hypothetical protein